MPNSVSFSDFRSKMRDYLERENNVNLMEVEADTLEEALNDASLELSIPYKDLDYEVLERGTSGIFGYGRKKWRIVAYKNSYTKLGVSDVLGVGDRDEEILSTDGLFFIRKTPRGIFLKVVAPKGQGGAVNFEDVMNKLRFKVNRQDLDKNFIRSLVENANGKYERIGDFDADPSESVTMMVQISEDSMSVTIEFTEPGDNGYEILDKDIFNILKKYGISERAFLRDKIENFVDFPIYGEPVEMARGAAPIKGSDSYVKFIFDDKHHGEPDNLNIGFRNVSEGDELAEIVPLKKGTDGYTVFGKVLEAEDGSELEFALGENTIREGNKIIAKCNGYMSAVDGVIAVHDVYVIEGDVGPGTGNIVNNGMVLVKGSVLDGYNIMAKGGIEVSGLVGRCNLRTDGLLVLSSGVNGKGGSEIYSKRGIKAKFLENVSIKCHGDIEVVRGIVNSFVSCKRRVLCVGKKSKIVGSNIYAREEIRAYSIGSEGNAETSLGVGYDPEIKDLLSRFTKCLAKIEKRLEVVSKDVSVLKKNILATADKAEKSLKIDICNELLNEKKILILEIKMVKDKQESLQCELEGSIVDGKIFVEHTAYAGVKIHIRGVYYELSRDYNNVAFVEDDDVIKTAAYVPFKP
ncbi:FapA family protein [Borrelia sp. BU AG58]|uniref:FapA family protein n=1 Tax=Borrelia sp. BU AG58 TaxID=2887345 RepID=UPI001E607A26|nr:FapA family protein [Borrelia sp. BU AG58]UER67457.1 FapA family protein [Borrelia sp. BU AG58]